MEHGMMQREIRPYFDLVASGRKMRSIRRSRNISVEQVRRYMGFESVQSIYKWERGECLPQADTLIALSLLYQVNPIELLEEDAKASSSQFPGKLGSLIHRCRKLQFMGRATYVHCVLRLQANGDYFKKHLWKSAF